jgi:hypothetical protein
MASGPQHYRVAERTLNEVVTGVYPTSEQISFALAKAQVHATLALAAAAAVHPNGEFLGAWLTVLKEEEGTSV